MFLFSVIDFGEYQNKKLRRLLYESGQIMQAHYLIRGEHVWVERDASCGVFYRVAFGPRPDYPDLITLDELRFILRSRFGGLSEVVA